MYCCPPLFTHLLKISRVKSTLRGGIFPKGLQVLKMILTEEMQACSEPWDVRRIPKTLLCNTSWGHILRI